MGKAAAGCSCPLKMSKNVPKDHHRRDGCGLGIGNGGLTDLARGDIIVARLGRWMQRRGLEVEDEVAMLYRSGRG